MPIEDRELRPAPIIDEMKDAYMDYAMSVIVSRALPDVRDGLKPVHRRILYTMREENITPDRAFKKSASTVGNVIARYHPHGDSAVYDAMVRMAQDFSMRYMMVQGHGNFGSVDGDSAAAMRYTESRLSRVAMAALDDLDKDTVDWRPNFDASTEEPTVLPAALPNLLMNGSDGIAVGMATKIPPHNLRELTSGILALMDNPEMTVPELMEHIKGPDFPTGAMILGQAGIREAYETGRGSVVMRACIEVEDRPRDRKALIVTEIPYQVNKSRLLEKIAANIKDRKIEGISDLRDESDRNGMRIVMELTQGTHPEVVKNQLFKHSELQTNFGCNMVALVNNVPKVLNLRTILQSFVDHRREVVTRRSQYLLDKAERRAHIVEGLLKALDHIDEIIKTIRASADATEARDALMLKFEFSEVQAQAILDMRLQRLTGLERDKLESEYKELRETIDYLRGILGDAVKLDGVVKDELQEATERFGDDRRSEIIPFQFGEFNIEDLIAEEQMVVTISHTGYIKRVAYDTYRSQKRGGRGVSGTDLKEEDHLEHIFVTSTHHYLLFFTNKAKVFKMKVHQIGEYGRTARGQAIVNLLQVDKDEKIQAIIPVRNFEEGGFICTCTRNGIVKRSTLDAYANINVNGIIALTLRDDDELVSVRRSPGDEELMIVSKMGMSIRFNENDAREMGRTATGVRGIKLREDDYVVAMDSVSSGNQLLVVTEKGYGKRTELDQYPLQNRGGFGVKTLQLTDKTGGIVGARLVQEDHELMVSTKQGTLIRTSVDGISVIGRATQGVRVIRLGDDDEVTAIARIEMEDVVEDEELDGEEGEFAGGVDDEASAEDGEADESDDSDE
ncbi:MAG: DNA gyrase subunit A [Candidatus Eremiobacteraeota bacterium]|nr:DNA gyrase subunit A [Candidatus Eremiobacteraeota bacterium]